MESINNSFDPNKNDCIFLTKSIIIESDIDPNYYQGNNKDLPVKTYLENLSLKYDKTDEFSIKIYNKVFSAIKKTDHIFIRVKYDQSFGSKFKENGKTYPLRQREALIRLEPEGKNKWRPFIESIAYYKPELPIEKNDHNLKVDSSIDDDNSKIDDDKSSYITRNDVTEIKFQAEGLIKTLESVLNSITFNDNTPEELAAYKKNSFSPGQRSRVFLNDSIKIESDVDPEYSLGKNEVLLLKAYLNSIDSNYLKTSDFSIALTNITSSNVKKKPDPNNSNNNYYYIKVKYTQIFGSKFHLNYKYPIRDRVATIRMDYVGVRRWKAYIEAINYFNPAFPIESKDNNVRVVSFNLSPSAKVHQLITTLVQNAK